MLSTAFKASGFMDSGVSPSFYSVFSLCSPETPFSRIPYFMWELTLLLIQTVSGSGTVPQRYWDTLVIHQLPDSACFSTDPNNYRRWICKLLPFQSIQNIKQLQKRNPTANGRAPSISCKWKTVCVSSSEYIKIFNLSFHLPNWESCWRFWLCRGCDPHNYLTSARAILGNR